MFVTVTYEAAAVTYFKETVTRMTVSIPCENDNNRFDNNNKTCFVAVTCYGNNSISV